MLDPLSALSVATAVVTFVDFVAEVIQETKEISGTGSSAHVVQKKVLVVDLTNTIRALRARTPAHVEHEEPLRAEEQALDAIVLQCNEIATELISCLESLAIDHPESKWQSFRAALSTLWSQDKINGLVSRLDSHRREVALRILVLLNAKSDTQSRRQTKILDGLHRSTKDVVEVISITSSNMQTSLEQQLKAIGRAQNENSIAAKAWYEETISAILTLRDGNTQVIARPDIQDTPLTHREKHGPLQRSFTFTEGQHDVENPERSRPPLVALNNFKPVLKRILDCLFFRQLTDRVEEISPNYQRTFQWIFNDPSVNDKPWSNFMEWLQHGSGYYWINGKAGSGKSTLMKYISSDVRTRQAISLWAGSHSSVIGSFFVWDLGSPLQKSQSGLLRSLLLDVLDRHPSLIPSAFPNLCRYALSHSANRLGEPSFPELKKAFLNLVQQQNNSLRMCFFIDGIDEYKGDDAELIDLLKEVVTSSSNVKMVLSSRPTQACIEELSEYPSLRLQDLTHDDILTYVTDKLGQHRNMKSLEIEDPSGCSELISEISSKASGVFLWVMLVVRSLLRGLRNHDRIPDLRRRLDELPKGLETLYEHMLQSMTPIYRQQASQLFQIVMASIKVQAQQPLTALQLSFAEEPDLRRAMAARVEPLPSAVEKSRCEATEARLRSRCCGLVEVQEKPRKRPDGSRYILLHVTFLHKTVVEYLSMDSNWSTMLALNNDLAFDPHYALMSSCLSFAKTASHENSAISMIGEGLSDLSRSFIIYTAKVEEVHGEFQTAIVDGFQQVIATYQPSDTSQAGRSLHSKSRMSPSGQVSSFSNSMLFLALRYGLFRYVVEKLDDKPELAIGIQGTVLLREALYQFIFSGPITGEMSGLTYGKGCYYSKPSGRQYASDYWQNCIRALLTRGTDVNTRLPVLENCPENGEDLYSPWQMVLQLCVDLILNTHRKFLKAFEESDGWNSRFVSIIKLLIEHGAEPNAIWVSTQRSGSALSIFDWLLRPSWFIQQGQSQVSESGQLRWEKARSELTSLLRYRGGVEREWLGGKLITRNMFKHQLVPQENSQGIATTASMGGEPAGSMLDSVAAAKAAPRSRMRGLRARFVRKGTKDFRSADM